MVAARLLSGGLLACTLAAQAAAHVTLRYPLPITENDFLDNVRTKGLCGDGPIGEGAAWLMPGLNESTAPVTALTPGQPLNVSWDLHYAHQGGFMLELYDADMKLKHAWNSEDHWGCSVDSTVQEVTLTLPAEPCADCTLRFTRQALEWGAGYLFKSCAKVNIGPTGDACQGCSDRGTCGANGACVCDSSAATGFFYGAHCEYENECAADADCGANGKCIDVGDVSGPALQCFCEAGFFGEVETRPSGLQVRTCTRASGYPVPTGATFDNFLEGYNTTWDSPGGTFQAGVAAVNGTDVEMAMAAQTTSWVALGVRAVAPAGGKPAAGAEGESEPAAEGEKPAGAEGEYPKPAGAEGEYPKPAGAEGEYPKPAGAEGEYPKPAGAEGEPPAQAEAETATAPAAEAEAPSRRRRLAQAEGAPAEGEATPAAEVAPAEGEAAPAAEGEAPAAEGEGAAAEGEGAGGACAVQTTVYVPGVLGAGEAQNGTAAAAGEPAAEGEAPAAEGEVTAEAPAEGAPAAEGEAPAAGRRMLSMPAVEAESTGLGRRGAGLRGLLHNHGEGAPAEGEAGAEGEGAAAEGEGGGAAGKPTEIATGPCAGFKQTDPSAHAMANQDVVFAAARQVAGVQYFRVVDMFTPSRAKPQPDHVFCFDGACGSDSIEDAIGMEVAGVSYFKVKRKAIPDAGSLSDTCITAGQNYHVIYAYGQLTANASHTPNSALEIIPPAQLSNQDFYQVDELKYHGGGIGVTFEGRGTLSPSVDLLGAAPAAAAPGAGCLASTEDGFECMSSQLGGEVIIHYNLRTPTDTGATMAIETPNPGWVALGWPLTPGVMVGATAVIATTSAANGNVGVFELTAKSVDGILEVDGATTEAAAGRRLSQAGVSISDAAVEMTPARTIATFTREFDANFTGEGEMDLIAAYHDSDTGLVYHTSREGFTLSLEGDAAAPGAVAAAPGDAPAAAAPTDAGTDDTTDEDAAGEETGTPTDRSVDASSAPAPLTAAAAAAAAAAALVVALL